MPTYHLFSEEGQFYKANLHAHTTLSDGSLTAEQLKDIYKSMGYSVLAYTDHGVIVPHTELADVDFLPITAVEIDISDDVTKYAKGWPASKTYHLNLFSKRPDRDTCFPFERIYSVENIQKIIDTGVNDGFLVQYNHPRWSYQTLEDYAELRGLTSFEIYNNLSELTMHNGWTDYAYEFYSRGGGRAAAVATDDCHRIAVVSVSDCGGGWTMIKAPELSYDAITAALERKECYASTGPEIYKLELTVEPGKAPKLSFACSPCHDIVMLTDVRYNAVRHSGSDNLTTLDAVLPEDFDFFRIECKDEKGKAMTRAYFADEFGL